MKVKEVLPKQVNVQALKQLAERRTVQQGFSQTGCNSRVTSPGQSRGQHTTRRIHASEASATGRAGPLPAYSADPSASHQTRDLALSTRIATQVTDEQSIADDPRTAALGTHRHEQQSNTTGDLDQSSSTRVKRLQDHGSFAQNLRELIRHHEGKHLASEETHRRTMGPEEVIKIQELIEGKRHDPNRAPAERLRFFNTRPRQATGPKTKTRGHFESST